MSKKFPIIPLLSNIGAVGNGAAFVLSIGALYLLSAAGTFAGTTCKLQLLGPDGTTWIDVTSASFSAAGAITVSLPAGASVRAVLTAGTPAAFYCSLQAIVE